MDRTDKKHDDGRDLRHDAPLDDMTPAGPAGGVAVGGEPEERERGLPGPGDRPPGVVVDPDPRS
jgi:hypothetical protein